MLKHRSSTRLFNQKKKLRQQVRGQNDTASRLSFVVELDASTVSDYLSTGDISALLQACPTEFSKKFVNALSLRAPDRFAKENKTHLGRHCVCDWMRRLDGFYHATKCGGEEPFNVNRATPILQTPRGLHALGLAERLLKPFCVKNGRGEDMFAPVVCLLTEGNEGLFTQLDVTKAMNRVSDGAGSRFFYKFTTKRKAYSMTDFIDEHWDEIDGSTCRHCERLPSYRDDDYRGHSRLKWKDNNMESIRANCSKVYRPLKAGMERELQFVRFIPKPHKSGWSSKYNGLVAGVSTSGVFCGMYVVKGYWPYNNGKRRSQQQR